MQKVEHDTIKVQFTVNTPFKVISLIIDLALIILLLVCGEKN